MAVLHGTMLSIAAFRWMQFEEFGFPALPPPEGWSTHAEYFILSTGIADGCNVLFALLFVYGFFKQWKSRWILGAITLTAQVYSTVVYLIGMKGSGAAAEHPDQLIALTAIFFPFFLLFFLYMYWWKRGHLTNQGS